MGVKVFVENATLEIPSPAKPGGAVAEHAKTAGLRSILATNRRFLVIWVGAVLTPFLLQIHSCVQTLTPHKILQDLLVLDAEPLDDQVPLRCPVQGIRIAGVWWNIWPTYYHITSTGKVCHFVVPQYNMHGAYHVAGDFRTSTSSSSASTASENCEGPTTPIDYYFYHGSVGFYSFYEEGSGTYCADNLTADFTVYKLGSYDMNGQILADDRGSVGYRQSYWFGTVGLLWIIFRALVIRRSFIVFKHHLDRCQQHHATIHLRDAIIYVQETARLTAHGASNLQRVGVLYLLLEGFMSDLFLFITKDGLSALVQCISLCYNLAGIISVLFEMVESSAAGRRCCSGWPRAVRAMKRLFFNHETSIIGELLLVTVLQTYITTLNWSKMQDSLHVALAISYYLWGLLGHAFVTSSMVVFLFVVRSAGAAASSWWKYRSLSPLAAPCCVETALGARQKLVLVIGYVWSRDCRLYYAKDTLTSYGLMMAVPETCSASDITRLLLVRERINWFAAPRGNFVARRHPRRARRAVRRAVAGVLEGETVRSQPRRAPVKRAAEQVDRGGRARRGGGLQPSGRSAASSVESS